ncbi:hypothetical protein FF011L_15470 [Roseimaritima multifibrata]|uniref:Uncharacterized protein n=1 Tax=Roseimaritima multifibrata TaxID=1930274 RepID=A0A517MD34_9BACT|nr:hypothetical protein FF011L_15470 [Roseimaritima multifibrata]
MSFKINRGGWRRLLLDPKPVVVIARIRTWESSIYYVIGIFFAALQENAIHIEMVHPRFCVPISSKPLGDTER